jgi:imidazolonepropionase-like amidohydrolase
MQTRWRLRPLVLLVVGSVLSVSSVTSFAQVSAERVEGLRENSPRWHVLTGARVVIAPGKVLEKANVVLKDGVIVAAGVDVKIPAGARVWKLDGKTIYPGFIDMASKVGVPTALLPAPVSFGGRNEPSRTVASRNLTGRTLASDNSNVRPEQDVSQQLELKNDDVKASRELGFTSVLAAPASGVFRGQSALLNMSGADAKSILLQSKVFQHMSNEPDRSSRGAYPNSLMGTIALVRQTLNDAAWYQRAIDQKNKQERPEVNESLAALLPLVNAKQTAIYAADNEQAYQRIAKIRDEFKLHVIVQGNGYEYRRLDHLKAGGMSVIVPLTYPNAPEVDNPDIALDTSLESLQHWESAPSNLAKLNKAGIEIAVTSAGLKDPKKEFWARLRQAIRRGLPIEQALASITTTPAKLLGEQKRLGSIANGHIANLVIASGDLFTDEKANIEMTFVDGNPFTTEAFDKFELRGTWNVTSNGKTSVWNITGSPVKPMLTIDGVSVDLNVKDNQLFARYGDMSIIAEGRGDTLQGTIQSPQSKSLIWSATRTNAFVNEVKPEKPEVMPKELATAYPAGPFGAALPVVNKTILVRNATVWTSAKEGKLDNTDLLIVDGKIKAIGKALKAPDNALVIDANGKHVSPGIIDAHSHTAIMQGINEATSSITAEVRIGDVLDATSMNIYRQLAGGVTTANVLHGSANTIGGQNQVIKLRWGSDAEGLKLEGAFPGIKFALGENVKQSNSGTPTMRYPQTRMGVEQILRSAFIEAKAYKAEHEAWKKNPQSGVEPRRDLQMDTLVELLDRKRAIHIHSYRQDEILMFVRFAKEFNLKVATFQHVMEGYKVADEIASIGAGGSTFSDWWGYKMEVSDAVPFNGAIMHNAGVVTTFNSDSDELARHLNTEAAKAVKYGGLSETEAFNFVTINAAKQLMIADRTGSIEVGKDADFVIWSGSPLSTMSRAEQTWIEGRRYFDLESDARMRQEAIDEKMRITKKIQAQKLLLANTPSGKPQDKAEDKSGAVKSPKTAYEINQAYLELQQWLHMVTAHRTGYWAGSEAHECTEDL